MINEMENAWKEDMWRSECEHRWVTEECFNNHPWPLRINSAAYIYAYLEKHPECTVRIDLTDTNNTENN